MSQLYHLIFFYFLFYFHFRPKSGSMLLYSRKRVRYRRDGYCWKKRKDGKTTREDHMKLKVQGTEVTISHQFCMRVNIKFKVKLYWAIICMVSGLLIGPNRYSVAYNDCVWNLVSSETRNFLKKFNARLNIPQK